MYLITISRIQSKPLAVYRKPNILTTVKGRRQEYVDQLVRMSDDSTVKKVILEKTDLRRKEGRTKLIWLDCTEHQETYN
jgi:hypothetical protein